MKRTGEKALSIIGAVFTGISIFGSFIALWLFKMAESDSTFRMDLEMDLMGQGTLSPDEIAAITTFVDLFGVIIWLVIIGLIISLILTIVGIVSIWKDKSPKLAGILFIIGGLFSGFLSLTSILLYIAGILCLTRKPQRIDEPELLVDNYDETMRPL